MRLLTPIPHSLIYSIYLTPLFSAKNITTGGKTYLYTSPYVLIGDIYGGTDILSTDGLVGYGWHYPQPCNLQGISHAGNLRPHHVLTPDSRSHLRTHPHSRSHLRTHPRQPAYYIESASTLDKIADIIFGPWADSGKFGDSPVKVRSRFEISIPPE